jgi:hypothetical protein
MMKFLVSLSFGLGLAAAAPLTTFAQGPSDFQNPFVEQIRQKFPDFRVVKKIERFPERYNASVKLPIRAASPMGSNTERALVTLHDGVTGEPMESCFSPCTLHKSPGRLVFVFPYKPGHFTLPNEIQADPAGMYEDYPYWHGEYEVKLGPDFREAYVRGKMCEREFAKMDRTDRDAKPCYRMPPPVPDLEFSGYCKTVFDISPKGKVVNAKTTECSAKDFEITSLVAVSAWTYHPKIDRGMAVTRPGVEVTIRYDIMDFDDTLLDQNGERIEE